MHGIEAPKDPKLAEKVYNAVLGNDQDFLVDHVISSNLVNAVWDFSSISNVPDVLKDSPPLLSVAAYFGLIDTFNFLYSNDASLEIVDKVYLHCFYYVPFYFFIKFCFLFYRAIPHFSCNSKKADFLNFIENIGMDFQLLDKAKRSTMHYACQAGNLYAVKWLWIHGVPLDNKDRIGLTPLMLACQCGHDDIVDFLIENKADENKLFTLKKYPGKFKTRTLLHFACESNNAKLVNRFIKFGVNNLSFDGTPLNIISKTKCVEGAKILIENGADPNIQSESGEFPIISASRTGNLEMITVLYEAGARIDVLFDNNSPLKISLEQKHWDCAFFFMVHNASNFFLPELPAITLAKNNQVDMLLKLFENHINISERSKDGNTIFHFLGCFENISGMESLSSLIPIQDSMNKDGYTPLSLAVKENKIESVKFFLDHGCNPNMQNMSGFIFIFMSFFFRFIIVHFIEQLFLDFMILSSFYLSIMLKLISEIP